MAARSGIQRLGDRRIQLSQACVDIFSEMDPEGSTIPVHQYLEVPSGLSSLDDAEGISLPRYRKVSGVLARDLEEDTAVGPALVGLSS